VKEEDYINEYMGKEFKILSKEELKTGKRMLEDDDISYI
jgi:hypothetical protein